MGWRLIPDSTLNDIRRHRRIVCIFSHTSYWDFRLMTLYKHAIPGLLNNVHLIMDSRFFDGWYGRYVGLLGFHHTPQAKKATDNQIKKGGLVDKIIDQLRSQEKFILLLSPEGLLLPTEWRSGYYYISRRLEVPIMVIGFDYRVKTLVTRSPRYHHDFSTKVKMETILQEDMATIIPHIPDNSFVKVKTLSS